MSKDTKTPSAESLPANSEAAEVLAVTPLTNFPCIVDVVPGENVPVKYGEQSRIMPSGEGETVKIDSFFFTSPKSIRLKKIGAAIAGLKKQGIKQTDGTPIDSKWFNKNVRDPFHKSLRFAARIMFAKGKPTTLQLWNTTAKDGEVMMKTKHGFELQLKAPNVQAIADKAAKQSRKRAKRQKAKSARITPVVNAENVKRLDALKPTLPANAPAAA